MVSIRLARESDNPELLSIEKMCPQGTSLVLSFDRTPDFFSRSRIYEAYRIYVAEEEGKPVGTVGLAEKNIRIDGKEEKAAYIYDVRVHPDHRGKGIGSQLVERSLNEASEADLAYAVIAQDNTPSIALFRKLGFDNVGSFNLLNVPVFRRKERPSSRYVRTLTSKDVPQIVDLLNNYYANHDFYTGYDAESLLARIERLQGYGLVGIYGIEEGGKISACGGLWDYSKIFRVTAVGVSRKLAVLRYLLRLIGMFKETAKLPSMGEPFRLMYVTDLACVGGPETARMLIDYFLGIAHAQNSNFLCFALHPTDPLVPVIRKYKPIEMKYELHERWLKDKSPRKLGIPYIDPVDL